MIGPGRIGEMNIWEYYITQTVGRRHYPALNITNVYLSRIESMLIWSPRIRILTTDLKWGSKEPSSDQEYGFLFFFRFLWPLRSWCHGSVRSRRFCCWWPFWPDPWHHYMDRRGHKMKNSQSKPYYRTSYGSLDLSCNIGDIRNLSHEIYEIFLKCSTSTWFKPRKHYFTNTLSRWGGIRFPWKKNDDSGLGKLLDPKPCVQEYGLFSYCMPRK